MPFQNENSLNDIPQFSSEPFSSNSINPDVQKKEGLKIFLTMIIIIASVGAMLFVIVKSKTLELFRQEEPVEQEEPVKPPVVKEEKKKEFVIEKEEIVIPEKKEYKPIENISISKGKKESESTYLNQTPIKLAKAMELIKKYNVNTSTFDPKDIKFDHELTYKGIRIAWTNGKPITEERLQWLKDVIDTLPASFLARYPIAGVYSAEDENYPPMFIRADNVAAVTSGPNIYLNAVMASSYRPDIYEQISKHNFARTIYHEWAHVIQFYDIFYTFREEYLDYLVTRGFPVASFLFESANVLFDFATRAGWEYEYTDISQCHKLGYCVDGFFYCPLYFNNKAYKPKNPTPDFWKTTEYALMDGHPGGAEDMAEVFSNFLTCDKSVVFSDARIKWAEDFLGNSADYYCQQKRF